MRARDGRRLGRPGFTLTEMLVVVGIIVVVAGLLLPAAMRARRAARQSLCTNNMRQIGLFYLLYADRNEDYVPLGTSRFDPPVLYPIYVWYSYHTRHNQHMWVEGSPSAAMGPFMLARMLTPQNGKVFYCPAEVCEEWSWDANKRIFERALAGEKVTLDIGYAVRPMRRLWTHDPYHPKVVYPELMPRLMRSDRVAIVSEHPQLDRYNHGTSGAYQTNTLYGDGSVRPVPQRAFAKPLVPYLTIDSPLYPPGYRMVSNVYAINEDDPEAETIWRALDQSR